MSKHPAAVIVSLFLLACSPLRAQQQVPINNGVVSINASGSNRSFTVTLDQNVTSFSLSSPGEPSSVIVTFVQNAAGGWKVSGWAPNILNTSGINISTSPNASTTVSFLYDLASLTWTAFPDGGGGGGGGSGTVTTFGAGNLPGLFTTSVSNPTTTPYLNFSLALPGSSGQLLYNNAGAVGAEDPIVSGPTANGSAPTTNPVFVAGWDGTYVRSLSTDTSGRLNINVNGTVPVSGTFWQAVQPVSLSALPSLPAGSNNIGGVEIFDSAGSNKLAINSSGQIGISNFPATQTISGTVTANAGTGTFNIQPNASVNATQWAGTTLGAPSNYGTSPGAVMVPGVNAFVTNTPTVNIAAGQTITVTQPTAANLNATVVGTGTFAVQNTQQGIASQNIAQIGGTAVVADPCESVAKSFAVVNLTASGQIITGTASKKTYICSINLVVGAADNVALVEGTGTTCGTGTAGMAGGTTAATGWNFAANGGLTEGDGRGAIAATATAADNVCLLASSSAQISGTIAYVQE